MEIPAEVYWGIHTARALVNFPISRRAISNYPDLINALARVKQASARANRELGVLDPAKADVIEAVCERIVAGELHDQFVVGAIQGGAGTSTNMNINEVIANAGLEAMGHSFGEYEYLNPIDDINRSQVDQRRLPDRDQARDGLQPPAAARGAPAAHSVVRGEGPRVRARAQGGSHPAAGRRADDPRPGVLGLRDDPAPRTTTASPRSSSG